jgi:hypothetical protein
LRSPGQKTNNRFHLPKANLLTIQGKKIKANLPVKRSITSSAFPERDAAAGAVLAIAARTGAQHTNNNPRRADAKEKPPFLRFLAGPDARGGERRRPGPGLPEKNWVRMVHTWRRADFQSGGDAWMSLQPAHPTSQRLINRLTSPPSAGWLLTGQIGSAALGTHTPHLPRCRAAHLPASPSCRLPATGRRAARPSD